MDPRNRADDALARARARGGFVVTPDNATSPMDAESTVQIYWEAIGGYSEPATTPQQALPQHAPRSQSGQYDPYGQYDHYEQHDQQDSQRSQYFAPHGQYPQGQQAQVGQQDQRPAWPSESGTTGHGSTSTELPPNPYQAQRGPHEFGPLGSQSTNQSAQR